MGMKRKGFWTVVAILLAALTIYAVFSQSGGISPEELWETLQGASWPLLVISVFCMMGIIFFEGEAVRTILKGVGYPRTHRQGFLYGAADVYFSAITPSASGGQPASAFFMVRDGCPMVIVTAVLLLNLVMYTLAVVSIGLVCIVARWDIFFRFGLPSRILIVAGFLSLSGLSVLFFFMLKKQAFLFGIARKTLDFLGRHHLLRHPQKLYEKLDHAQKEYAICVKLMAGHKRMLFSAYVLNLLQRLSQVGVILSVCLATGGGAKVLAELFPTQMYIILGSNCVPVPGGMGVTDYLMLDGYGQLFPASYAFQLEMLGRSLSFYCSVLVSAITVLVGYMAIRKADHKRAAA